MKKTVQIQNDTFEAIFAGGKNGNKVKSLKNINTGEELFGMEVIQFFEKMK